MSTEGNLKFFASSTGKTWIDIDGRYLVVGQKDIDELHRMIPGPEIYLQSMPLTADQATVILNYFT